MPRDVVHEEIDNFLDDISIQQAHLKCDILSLDNEIANVVYNNILVKHRHTLPDPNVSLQVYMDRLMENDTFQNGVQMIRGAIEEEMKK
jgi:hypothetical protein